MLTDTNSLTYEIKSKNVYEDFYKWKDLFHFSNFSKGSKFYKSKSDKSKNNNNYDNKDQWS